jgi:hypothetical protein
MAAKTPGPHSPRPRFGRKAACGRLCCHHVCNDGLRRVLCDRRDPRDLRERSLRPARRPGQYGRSRLGACEVNAGRFDFARRTTAITSPVITSSQPAAVNGRKPAAMTECPINRGNSKRTQTKPSDIERGHEAAMRRACATS